MKSYPRALVLWSLFLVALGLGGCVAGSGAAGLVLLALGAAAALAGCTGGPGPGDGSSPRKYPCCVNGQQMECSCDAGFATCNYSPVLAADSGLCMYPPQIPPPDSLGNGGAPDGAADAPTDMSLDLAGPDRAGGFDYQCCNSGRLETCHCPPLTACNYGLIVNCGDGTCYERLLPNVDPDGGSCRSGDGGGQ